MLHRILSTPIASNLSLVATRDRARQVGELFGLDDLQRTRFVTAVSEIARNAVQFAGGGTLTFLVGDSAEHANSQCIVAQIADKGPGIARLDQILSGVHHEGTPGMGLPGSRRMADAFSVATEPGRGTTVTIEMLLPRDKPRLTLDKLSVLVDQLTRRKAQTPVEELEQQNREMLLTLGELRRKQTELEEADVRKNEFLAMLAHELRNPLAAISLALEVAGRGTPATGDQADTFALIGRQTAQLSRMVNDLLDVSRLTRGKVDLHTEVARVDDLITGALEMTAAEVTRRAHRIRTVYPKEAVLVRGDVARLKQVFSNILHNAARYTSEPDEIVVKVEASEQEVNIEVTDHGIGIEPGMLPRVFDLFAQASTAIGRQDAGLGIGLTVVKRLVHDHGGSAHVESAGIGRGTTFVVKLPRVYEPLPDDVAEMAAAPQQRAQRILIVDDNRDAAEALEALLTMSGHECEVAYDGASALDAADAFMPTVAVIDIGLPDMTGFEVARGLREKARGRALFLVALSGYTTPDFRENADDAGFDHYFAKPMSIDDLYACLAAFPAH
ncbi:ATP-binding response regulator [Caballeronia humi]|uniref:histidine kinase n=1 Tax=Caballeronia humi TaxID=326474 RepID=A0A158GSK2_9BURK|nr:ATP-binding protein [Caballeronia humi]SAL34781.1 PAS/PAC sensor hybrid histidine kinase [Caballeronia humi]